MPIYIYKENSQISTNAVRNHKVVKAIYAKEQGQGAVCVWGIDRSIPYDQMFTYSVSSDNKVTITGLKPEVKTSYIVIPDIIDNKPVSSIGSSAFKGENNIVSITIPSSVTTISEDAFNRCTGLTSITIPNSVTSIGSGAFYFCSGLTSITIPNSVTSIGQGAFMYCGFTSVTIPDSVTSIGARAFTNCSYLTSVNISDSVTTISEEAFSGCGRLVSVVIPDSVTTIEEEAFAYCTGLTSVTVGKNVTSIGFHAFYDCYKLIEVYNKSNLAIKKGDSSHNGQVALYAKNVYWQANGSKLTNDNGYVIYTEGYKKILVAYTGTSTKLILPSYVTEIYQYAFYSFYSLTNVTIPDSVTSIGERAFYSCSDLTSITFKGTMTQWNAISKGSNWNDNTGNYTIHCTDGNIPKS